MKIAAASAAAGFQAGTAHAQLNVGVGAATGGMSLTQFFNNLANVIISDVGSIAMLCALALALLVAGFGGGWRLVQSAVLGLGGVWCVAWIVGRLTGGASAFGSA